MRRGTKGRRTRYEMSHTDPNDQPSTMSRREFVQTAAATGLMLTIPGWVHAQSGGSKKPDELAVAIIGPGSQGRWLMNHSLKVPGVRYVAICDIWEYHQRYARNILKKYGHQVNVYDDYRELLAKEPQLDAVIVATPDWMHAEHAIACLEAGKHVYCEKEMSNTLESAAKMVRTADKTGKLLQIGHQRRSNPRYWHALKMIEKDRILGRITHTYGQWNRAQLLEAGWPKGQELSAATLKRFGYGSMEEFRNWRWYRKYSGGPMADLGSHQIDIFNWFLKAKPTSVMANGGLDYYVQHEGRDWYDNVLAIYEYDTPAGPVRSFYQVLNTTSAGGYYEQFMGDQGTLQISEDPTVGHIFREVHAKRRQWEDEAEMVEKMGRDAIELKLGETLTAEGDKAPEAQEMATQSEKHPLLLHLENFFGAIRGENELTCPANLAYETCASVLKANDAVSERCTVSFKPDDFKA